MSGIPDIHRPEAEVRLHYAEAVFDFYLAFVSGNGCFRGNLLFDLSAEA